MTLRSHLLPLLGLVGLLLAGAPGALGEGPTPYPSKSDEAAWPGKGPIRVFAWMPVNRESFWAHRERDRGAVVFAGSSTVGNWKRLKEAFPNLKVANRGIGGDVSRGLLFRLQEDVLDLEPRALVLAIGSNDLSAHAAPAIIEENVAAIIDLARARYPKLPIVLCPVIPRHNPKAPLVPGALDDYNARLVALGARKNVLVPDLRTPFTHPDGSQILEYFRADHMHLSPAGYKKLGEVLAAEFARLGIE